MNGKLGYFANLYNIKTFIILYNISVYLQYFDPYFHGYHSRHVKM